MLTYPYLHQRILVVGGNSKIARPLIDVLLSRGDTLFKTSRRNAESGALFLDLLNVDSFLQKDPPDVDIVVFCAAITKFEDCRKDLKQAYAVNVSGPARLASYYAKAGAKIIQLSTNAVFDGKTPFVSASTAPNARNGYGGLKAEAEAEFIKINGNVAILRLTKIIIPGNNIFFNWLSELQQGQEIRAFKDQYFSPVTIDLAIRAILAVIDDDNNVEINDKENNFVNKNFNEIPIKKNDSVDTNNAIEQIKNIVQEKNIEKNIKNKNEQNDKFQIKSFDNLIKICTLKKELKLKYELETNVNLVSFENRRIEISFNEDLDKEFIKILSIKLFEWTNERWIISLSKEAGKMSRKSVIKDNKKKLLDDAKKSMTYKKILASFSDAQLIDVESEDKN